jgi:hypothetical protein
MHASSHRATKGEIAWGNPPARGYARASLRIYPLVGVYFSKCQKIGR